MEGREDMVGNGVQAVTVVSAQHLTKMGLGPSGWCVRLADAPTHASKRYLRARNVNDNRWPWSSPAPSSSSPVAHVVLLQTNSCARPHPPPVSWLLSSSAVQSRAPSAAQVARACNHVAGGLH